MATQDCWGGHRYFLADVILNQTEGKAFVVAICTACGNPSTNEITVGHPGDSLRLLLEEKKRKE